MSAPAQHDTPQTKKLKSTARAFHRTRQAVTFQPTEEPIKPDEQSRRIQAHETATKALVTAAVAFAESEQEITEQ